MHKRLATTLTAVGIIALGAGSFLIGRALTVNEGAEAETPAQQTAVEGPIPSDDATPVAGTTPDRTQPFWYVPYLNRDATLPTLEGELNGISIGRPSGPGGQGRCLGATTEQGAEAESRYESSAVGIRGLPAGMDYFQRPAYTLCQDGIAHRAEATARVSKPRENSALGAGPIYITRFIGAPGTPMRAPVERWSAMQVEGRPAALLRPVIESVGSSALVVYEADTGVVTELRGEGVYPDSLIALMEAILK